MSHAKALSWTLVIAVVGAMVACENEGPLGPNLRNRPGVLPLGGNGECQHPQSLVPGVVFDYDPNDPQLMDTWWIFATQDPSAGGIAPPDGDTDAWHDQPWCDGEGGGGQPPPQPASCDPTQPGQAGCERAFTPAEKGQIDRALRSYVKRPSDISDTTTRRQCAAMIERLGYMMAGGTMMTSYMDSVRSHDSHYGAYNGFNSHYPDRLYTGFGHVDAWVLKEAETSPKMEWELANTLLHEAAHALGFEHPTTGEGGQVIPGTDLLIYFDEPFDKLNPYASHSCMNTRPTGTT